MNIDFFLLNFFMKLIIIIVDEHYKDHKFKNHDENG